MCIRNNPYTVTVSNNGTAATTVSAMTVTDVLPPELAFVSGGGINGFTCSASAQVITCTRLSGVPLNPAATLSFTVTVAVSTNAPSPVTHSLSVSQSEDLNPSNNTGFGTVTVQQPPVPTLSFTPATLT